MLIILVVEHIAIAKSFSRKFNYKIDPSQEILAQGASNLIGTFVDGYSCTGSFSASAVLSGTGSKTPLAGLFSAFVLVLALYAFAAAFYYILMAALAGLIIHAVSGLVIRPRTLYRYWKISPPPPKLVIWVAGVTVAIFVSLEASIYVSAVMSLALLLTRIARAKGQFFGQINTYRQDSTPRDREPIPDSGDVPPRTPLLPDMHVQSSNKPPDSVRHIPPAS